MWQCDRKLDDVELLRSPASDALPYQSSHAFERLFYALLLVICRPYIQHNNADTPIVNSTTQYVGELFGRFRVTEKRIPSMRTDSVMD